MTVFIRYDSRKIPDEIIYNAKNVNCRIQQHRCDPELGEYDVLYVSIYGDGFTERQNVLDLEIS